MLSKHNSYHLYYIDTLIWVSIKVFPYAITPCPPSPPPVVIYDVALIARREQSSITTPVSMLHFGGAQDPNRLTDGR